MRSVWALLLQTTKAEAIAYLEFAYPSQRTPWVVNVGDETHLYIDFSDFDLEDFEPDEQTAITTKLRGNLPLSILVNVSGRHPGDQEVADFLQQILSQFEGYAMDDYTAHLWSLNELQNGHRVHGHRFFDYDGWYEEYKSAGE